MGLFQWNQTKAHANNIQSSYPIPACYDKYLSLPSDYPLFSQEGDPSVSSDELVWGLNDFHMVEGDPVKDELTAISSSPNRECKVADNTIPQSLTLVNLMGKRKRETMLPKTRKRKPAAKKVMTPLPEHFQPSEDSVLCGKGNDYFNAEGKEVAETSLLLTILTHANHNLARDIHHFNRKSTFPCFSEDVPRRIH